MGDLSGRIFDVNNNLLHTLGYTRDEFLSMSWIELTPKEFHGMDSRAVEQMVREGYGPFIEKEYFAKDGRRVPALAYGIQIDNERETAIGVMMDLTEKKRIEREMMKTTLEKTTFVTHISHGKRKKKFFPLKSHFFKKKKL